MATVLTTPRLVLDRLSDDDAPAVYDACQDQDIQDAVPIPSPFTREDAEFFVTAYARHGEVSGQYRLWAVRLRPDGPLIGTIELRRDADPTSSSFGCWIAAPWRRNGYAAEALRAVIEYAFSEDGLDLHRVRWEGIVGNEASKRLATSLGFRAVQRNGQTFTFRGVPRPSWTAILDRSNHSDPPS